VFLINVVQQRIIIHSLLPLPCAHIGYAGNGKNQDFNKLLWEASKTMSICLI
jgi:hypothetical protein